MRKIGIVAALLFGISTIFADIPTRYYIGVSEVNETFFNTIPDSIKTFRSEFDYDTVIIKSVELTFTHYIDSISDPGNLTIKERSKEEIEILLNRLKSVKHDSQSLRLQVGDSVPSFSLLNFNTNEIETGLPKRDNCFLLSFWATWCGNCLAELKPEFIPNVAKEFSQSPNFKFMPVCIDSTVSELQEFFVGSVGSKWDFLADETYIDDNRNANEIFALGGYLPLNVIIGTDGRVKYIHLGRISEKEDLDKLREFLSKELDCEPCL